MFISIKNTGYIIGFNILNFFLLIVGNIVLARYLGADQFGDFSIAYFLANLLVIFSLLGKEELSYQQIAVYSQQKSQEILKTFLAKNLRQVLLISIATALAVIVAYVIYRMQLREVEAHHPIVIAALLIPAMAFTRLFAATLIGHNDYLDALIPLKLQLPSFIIIFIVAYSLIRPGFSDHEAILLILVVWIIIGLVIFKLTYRKLHITHLNLSTINTKHEWLSGVPFMNLVLSYAVIQYNGAFFIEIFQTDENTVGTYSAVIQIINIFAIVFVAMQTLLFPKIATILQTKNLKIIQRFIILSILLQLSILIVINSAIIVYGSNVLQLFGNEFTQAKNPLIISSIGYSIPVVSSIFSVLLVALNLRNKIIISAFISAILSITINFFAMAIWSVDYFMEAAASSILIPHLLLATYWFYLWFKNKSQLEYNDSL